MAGLHPDAREEIEAQEEEAAALRERIPSTGEGGGLGGEGEGGGGEGHEGRVDGRTLVARAVGTGPQTLVPEKTSRVRAVSAE